MSQIEKIEYNQQKTCSGCSGEYATLYTLSSWMEDSKKCAGCVLSVLEANNVSVEWLSEERVVSVDDGEQIVETELLREAVTAIEAARSDGTPDSGEKILTQLKMALGNCNN